MIKEKHSLSIEEFDVLCAGFPCQAFSIAGNRKGFADTRGTLFFDVEKIIQKHRPKAVFLFKVILKITFYQTLQIVNYICRHLK